MTECGTGECQGCSFGGRCYCCEDSYNESTEGHGLDAHCFTRMLDNLREGDLDQLGCDVGCFSCRDFPDDLFPAGANGLGGKGGEVTGKRWLKPPPGAVDATGRAHELRSRGLGESTHVDLFPALARFKHSPCMDAITGSECPEDQPCDCWPGPNTLQSQEEPCGGGVDVNQPVPGVHPEGFVYTGDRWPPDQTCRRFYEMGSTGVEALSDGNTTFIRSSVDDTGCASNWLQICAAFVYQNSQCPDSYGETGPHGPEVTYVGTVHNACKSVWDELRVVEFTGRIRQSTRIPMDPTVRDMHNAALALLSDPNAFPGTDFLRIPHQAPPNVSNQFLGSYQVSWDNLHGPIADAPLIAVLPASRTKWHGCPVHAELVAVEVVVQVKFIPDHPIDTRVHPGPGANLSRLHYIEPHALINIRIRTGIRAVIADPESPCTILPGDHNGRFPGVTPDGNEILYAVEPGKWIRPPAVIEWRGQRNHYTEPATVPLLVDTEDVPAGVGHYCKRAAEALGVFTVGARQWLMDSRPNDAAQLYEGEMVLTFDGTSGFMLCDAEPEGE